MERRLCGVKQVSTGHLRRTYKILQRTYGYAPTPVLGAFAYPWIFPRPKNVPPARFLNGLSNPFSCSATKSPPTRGEGGIWGIMVLTPSSRRQASVHRTLALNGSNPSFSFSSKKSPHLKGEGISLAEKEGFEPSIPFWGIHDFQSCALGQLRDFSISCPGHAVQQQLEYSTTRRRICQFFFHKERQFRLPGSPGLCLNGRYAAFPVPRHSERRQSPHPCRNICTPQGGHQREPCVLLPQGPCISRTARRSFRR